MRILVIMQRSALWALGGFPHFGNVVRKRLLHSLPRLRQRLDRSRDFHEIREMPKEDLI